MKKEVMLLFVLAVLTLPLISAYSFGSWGGGYYNSPLDLFDNEWVIFGIIFIVFFAIIFFTVNKAFKTPGVSAVIALGLSLLIAITLARRGMLYGYFGDEVGSWVLIVTCLIGAGFIIRFAYESFGGLGAIISVGGLWYILHSIDPYEVIPYQILTDTIISVYEFVASWLGGIILMALTILLINIGREERTTWDILTKPRKRRFNWLGN